MGSARVPWSDLTRRQAGCKSLLIVSKARLSGLISLYQSDITPGGKELQTAVENNGLRTKTLTAFWLNNEDLKMKEGGKQLVGSPSQTQVRGRGGRGFL